jgi:hypothetical protein
MPGTTQPANTSSFYKFSTIREDLEDFVYKISPLETPVMQAIGRKGAFENTYHEWPIVELAAANPGNAQIEGVDVTADAPTGAMRRGNYAQLMNKVKFVSSTNERIRGAGGVQRMAKQVLYGTQEIKRDMEARIAGSGALGAVGGSDTVARQTASIAAFIATNAVRGAGGAGPLLSSTPAGSAGQTFPNAALVPAVTFNGYPQSGATAGVAPGEVFGTTQTITETMLKSAIQQAWTQGGDPTYAFCSGSQKIIISTFTGNATRFKKAEDKKLVAAIDVYISDFGELQIVPDRFIDSTAPGTPIAGKGGTRVLIIDPEYAEIGWLQGMSNTPLAKTGNAEKRLIACEWGVIVGNEKAHAQVTDLQ